MSRLPICVGCLKPHGTLDITAVNNTVLATRRKENWFLTRMGHILCQLLTVSFSFEIWSLGIQL